MSFLIIDPLIYKRSDHGKKLIKKSGGGEGGKFCLIKKGRIDIR